MIHIPEEVKQKSLLFEVLAKGRDCVDDEITVGTYVYTGRFAPLHLEFPGHPDWYSLNEVDALGIVTEYEEETVTLKGAA